ncbi:MAG: PAS domain-containing sensor histidine kinase [bacterium]|nr:PAS domain-containing sensor histidine kinase [bacterium]
MLLNLIKALISEYMLVLIFVLSLIFLLTAIYFFISVKNEKKRWNKINDYLVDITKTVNSVRYGDLTKKINKFDIPDSENLTESLNRMIETLHDREVMVSEYQIELVKQNKVLEAIINSLSEGLVITDNDGIILRTTDIITQWFNTDGKKLVGKHLSEYIEVINKRPLSIWKDNEVVLLSDKSSNFIASTVELKLEDKKPRYIVILKNITDQKELENLKEDFVATLTHDLKVPIIAETNMIELLLNENFGKISEKQHVALKNMQSSNRELLDLVQTVLETYKIGKMTLYKENIMLKSFIEEIIAEMQPIAKKTQNTLELIFERDIRVFADRFQLTRVIKNLIQNAISYGEPKTPIEITIGEIPKFVTIKIKDHGAGISKSDIDRIFNKYYSAAKKFRKIGTGLGLYLAFQIVKAHNGELSVESTEGEFTEFCIKIPV